MIYADSPPDRLSAGVQAFALGWRRMSGRSPGLDPQRLRTFVRQVRPLLSAPLLDRSPPPAVDALRLRSAVASLAPALMAARATAATANAWTLAGLKHHEVRNAAVLAALWSPGVAGTTAVAFLDAFLRRLPAHDALPSAADLALPYVVRTEHCAAGMASERVDITIEGKGFVLGIEVKIRAGEGPSQLTRYAETIASWGRARDKRAAVILLAPFKPSVAGIVPATWGDVIAAARAALPRRERDYGFTHRLLADFMRHVAPFRKG